MNVTVISQCVIFYAKNLILIIGSLKGLLCLQMWRSNLTAWKESEFEKYLKFRAKDSHWLKISFTRKAGLNYYSEEGVLFLRTLKK